MTNYSFNIAHANAIANDELLGVQLGRLCISNNIPVRQVASDLGVTKSVVYRWFTGRSDVSKHLRDKVKEYKDTGALSTLSGPNANILWLELTS